MTVRRAHGRAAKLGRLAVVEVLPPDELPRGVHAAPLVEGTAERHADGRFAPGARTAQSAGGQAVRGMTRLAGRLALGETFADPRFVPYARAARAFRREQCRQLARSVGGGTCGVAASSIVASASLQLASSRFAFEVLGDMALGSRLGDASRQNLLAAFELVAKEAECRPRSHSSPVVEDIERRAEARLRARRAAAEGTSETNDEEPDR